ncbi:MAG TPA: hypothetical protein VGL06_16895 [Pseudonocardiaceae bacterium]
MRLLVPALAVVLLVSCSTQPPQSAADIMNGVCADVRAKVDAIPPVKDSDTNYDEAPKLATEYSLANTAETTFRANTAPRYQAFVSAWGALVTTLQREQDTFNGNGLATAPGSDTSNALRLYGTMQDTQKAEQAVRTAANKAGLTECGQQIAWRPER